MTCGEYFGFWLCGSCSIWVCTFCLQLGDGEEHLDNCPFS